MIRLENNWAGLLMCHDWPGSRATDSATGSARERHAAERSAGRSGSATAKSYHSTLPSLRR